ncbi:MAG: AAA family ATPase [Solirubrobacterales bacterium]|nr:AAA family ATPase [Solirubrobacterales bacterium]
MNDSELERLDAERPGSAGTAASLGRIVKRNLWIIILTTIAATGAAFALTKRQHPRYESTALLQFSALGPEYQILGVRYVPTVNDEAAQEQVDAVFVGSRPVAVLAASRTRPRLTADEVQNLVKVALQAQGTRIVAVTASGGTAGAAAGLANIYARAASDIQRADDARRAEAAKQALEVEYAGLPYWQKHGNTGDSLRSNMEELDTLARIGTGSPQLLDPALPASAPVSPKPTRTAILGALFGLLLGAAIAAVREQSDRRLRDRRQVATAFDARVLAEIPRARGLRKGRTFGDLPPSVVEAFQLLQANLRYAAATRTSRVMLTSAVSDEGKSTVAWNLAAAAVAAGLRVLVVEADLRRPELAQRYGLDPSPGLAEVLSGSVAPSAAVRTVSKSASSNGAGPAEMSALVAGEAPDHPTKLFQSHRLPEVLEEAGHNYDLVLIDAPPLPTADAVPLVALADGVVIVTYVGRAKDADALQLREQLENLAPRVLGVVTNGVT